VDLLLLLGGGGGGGGWPLVVEVDDPLMHHAWRGCAAGGRPAGGRRDPAEAAAVESSRASPDGRAAKPLSRPTHLPADLLMICA
jgi:hypothetical protein